jgi:hypothetical protein
MSRIFDRKRKGSVATATQSGSDPAVFSAAGVASVTSADEFIAQFGGTELLGNVGVYDDVATAGNVSLVVTVPANKYWRLLSAVVRVTADATAANRLAVCLLRDGSDTTIETLTQTSAVTANQDLVRTFGFTTDANAVGVLATAAAGTLTMDTNPTAADTMVLNGTTFTFVAALTGVENEILIGANVAATKVSVQNAVGATPSGAAGDHSVTAATRTAIAMTGADFSGDDMVFTAATKGIEGNSLATTETFSAGTNVFDAATLGTTTAGVSATDEVGTTDYPTSGAYLVAGEDAVFSVTNGVAGDNFEVYLTYIEFDDVPV